MPKRFSELEQKQQRTELVDLYLKKNKSIKEISTLVGKEQTTVYSRLIKFEIPIQRSLKAGFNNIRSDVFIPTKYSKELAEFIGIMLGDGNISPTQVSVCLGTKEDEYRDYIINLITKLFGAKPKFM